MQEDEGKRAEVVKRKAEAYKILIEQGFNEQAARDIVGFE